MTYSCAIFSRGAQTLASAQEARLELEPDQRVLDIHRLRLGKLRDPRSKVPRRSGRRRDAVGLEDQIEIRVADYRELADEPFDAVASIGMIEHGGARQLGIAPAG